jgi:Xaa-Pro aminopeptidase
MEKAGASAYLLVSLDDIAWLYNLRGSDLEHTPVASAYAFIDMESEYLFINTQGLSADLKAKLIFFGVRLREYDEIYTLLREYNDPRTVLTDYRRLSVLLRERLLGRGFETVNKQDITAALKSVKNDIEIKNIERCQINDGAAVTKFIIWLKENIANLDLNEYDIHEKLFAYRRDLPHYVSPSFSTIAAYMANAALMHYSPPKSGGAKIE